MFHRIESGYNASFKKPLLFSNRGTLSGLEIAVERRLLFEGEDFVELHTVGESDSSAIDRHDLPFHDFFKCLFLISPLDLKRHGFSKVQPFARMKKETRQTDIGDHDLEKRNLGKEHRIADNGKAGMFPFIGPVLKCQNKTVHLFPPYAESDESRSAFSEDIRR